MVGIRCSIFHLGLLLLLLFGLIIPTAKIYALDKSIMGEQNGSINIEWVDSANSYQVQIRRDGQIFIDTVQNSNRLSLNLAPGEYQYKISTLSPFGKTVSETEWLALTVQTDRVPFFRVRSPLTVWEGDAGVRLTVESTELGNQTAFYLQNEDESIPVEWMEEEGSYSVTIPDGVVGIGNWDLRAVNPSGKSFTYPEALLVRSVPTFTINKLDINVITYNRTVPVGIEGANLKQDMVLVFQGPSGVIPVAALDVIKEEFAIAYLDLEGAALGTYDLIVHHPGREDFRKPGALTVIEPDEESSLIVPSENLSIQIGMTPMWVVSERLTKPLPAYFMFDIAGLIPSGSKKRVLRDLGVEARVNLGFSSPTALYQQSIIDSPNGPGRGSLTTPDAPSKFIGSVDLSIYYRPFVPGRVAPVFQIGFGNLVSRYLNSIYIRQVYTPTPPDTVTRGFKQYFIQNLSFMLLGVGVDIADSRGVTRLGASYRVGNFIGSIVDDPIHVLSLTVRRRLRFIR